MLAWTADAALTDPIEAKNRGEVPDHADEGARVSAVVERRVQRSRQCEQSNDPNSYPHPGKDAAEFLTKFTMSKNVRLKPTTTDIKFA